MKIKKIIDGGFLIGYRTYLVSIIGILSAVGTYLSGDLNIFEMLNAIFPLAGIYFLRKSKDKQTKRIKNGYSKKVSE